MRILSHYFVARYLGLFTLVFVAAIVALATVELVLNLDGLSGINHPTTTSSDPTPDPTPSPTTGQGAFQSNGVSLSDSAAVSSQQARSGFEDLLGLLRSLAVRLTSYYISELLPIASFIAVFLSLSIAGRRLERIATEAAGIRTARLVIPILATALILSLVSALLHETLILDARRVWAQEKGSDPSEIDFGNESFWLNNGRTITNVSQADPESRILHGVEIFERSDGGSILRVIRAESARISDDGRWFLSHAVEWTFDPDDPRKDPVLVKAPQMELSTTTQRGDRLLAADPRLLPLPDLAAYLRSKPPISAATTRQIQAGFHDRLSRPWLLLAFAWLAVPFGLRVGPRGNFARPAAAAIALLGAYFLVENAGRVFAQQELFPIGLTPWLVMLVFSFAVSINLFWNARRYEIS